MNNEKLGIDETVEMARFATALVSVTDNVLADGKVNTFELLKYGEVIPLLKPAITGANKVLPELADLDDNEKNLLQTEMAAGLDLRNDAVEEVSEDIIRLSLSLAAAIRKVRILRSRAVTA